MKPSTPKTCQCPGNGPCLGQWPCTRPHKLVEIVNSLSPSEFFQRYLAREQLSEITSNYGVQGGQRLWTLLIAAGSSLTPKNKSVLEECLQLIESTSADDYRNSEMKWSVSKKRKEMLLPDMRYVVLMETNENNSNGPKVAAFVSYMITYEDGKEVVYCYEIHLTEAWQGKGIGRNLMELVEGVGRKVGVEKSMLTVFKANERAVKMYERIGYSEDEFSPGPRKLRNGTVKEPSYVILSKDLRKIER